MSNPFAIIPDPRNDRVFIKLESTSDDILYEVNKAFYEMGRKYYDFLYAGLKFGKRSGRKYQHTNVFTGKKYSRVSSAAGEFPQKQSGALQRGVAFNANGVKLIFGIQNPNNSGEDVDYAEWLENGTKNKKLKPRLLVKYTVKQNEKEMQKNLENRLDKAIKSIGV